jgi:hypothetical protein
MYISSIKHHDGDLAEKIKDLSLNHFLLYELFLFYLARNKGSFNLDSDEFQSIYLLLKKKSRVAFKEVIPILLKLAEIGAWEYNSETNTIFHKQLMNLSSKFSKGGKKGQDSKKKSLEVQPEAVINQLSKSEAVKLGKYQSNGDLVNRLIEFNQQGNHNAFKSIIDYERLTTKIKPETIIFYLDNVEAFKKAAALDTGKVPTFKNGYFRIMNEFKKAVDLNLDLKPELPEWVKVASIENVNTWTNPGSTQSQKPQRQQFPEHTPENWKKFWWVNWSSDNWDWWDFLKDTAKQGFQMRLERSKEDRKRFFSIYTAQEWSNFFDKWFHPDTGLVRQHTDFYAVWKHLDVISLESYFWEKDGGYYEKP